MLQCLCSQGVAFLSAESKLLVNEEWKIKSLTKNKIKYKGEKYEKDSKFRNNGL